MPKKSKEPEAPKTCQIVWADDLFRDIADLPEDFNPNASYVGVGSFDKLITGTIQDGTQKTFIETEEGCWDPYVPEEKKEEPEKEEDLSTEATMQEEFDKIDNPYVRDCIRETGSLEDP